jgi:hypothetical protein
MPLLLGLLLGGCATSNAGSSLMDARAEAPAPPGTGAYLPVEDLPPPRAQPLLTPEQRMKITKELTATRDRQVAAGKAQATALAGPLVKP